MNDPTSGMGGSPARDASAALACAGGDQALADELLSALLAELPAELDQLWASIDASNWAAVVEQTHHLRGATRYCAVTALDQAVEALEHAARLGDPPPILAAMTAVETQARRLVAWCG